MGWWWSSSQKGESDHPQTSTSNNVSQPLQQPQEPSQSQPPETMTREQKTDYELNQFLAMLNAQESRKPSTSSSPDSKSSQSQSQSQGPPTLSESVYPDTMSCRSAFDYLFFCHSFGGHFTNWYRHGELRDCSEHWNNLKVCMKTQSYGEEKRRKTIRDYYKQKAAKYKSGPSSEDVWDVRTEPARNAFQGDFIALEKEMEAEGSAQHKAASN